MANGIPALLNQVGNVINTAVLLTADAALVMNSFLGPQWGIIDGVTPIITPDSIASFGYRNEYLITDAPMEQGSFQSINKVATPYEARVTMTKGGSEAERSQFLNDIANLVKSTNLHSVLTPEITYLNANIVSYEYRRTSTNGVGLLTVDIILKEVRLIPAGTTSSSTVQAGTSTPAPAVH